MHCRPSPVAVLRLAAAAVRRRDRSPSGGPHPPDSAVRDADVLSAAQPCSWRVLPFLSRPSEHGSTIPATARLSRVESLRPQRNADRYPDDAYAPRARTNGLSRGERVPSAKRDGTMGGARRRPRARRLRPHLARIWLPPPSLRCLQNTSRPQRPSYAVNQGGAGWQGCTRPVHVDPSSRSRPISSVCDRVCLGRDRFARHPIFGRGRCYSYSLATLRDISLLSILSPSVRREEEKRRRERIVIAVYTPCICVCLGVRSPGIAALVAYESRSM